MSPRWIAFAACLSLAASSTAHAKQLPPPPAPTVEIADGRVTIDRSPTLSTDLVFEVGEVALRPAVLPVLEQIAKLLARDPSPRISISVHTDDTAPDNDHTGAWTQKLSQRRAEALKAWFARKGVAARRLAATGLGATAPVANNANEDGKRANRRIEIALEAEVRAPVAGDLPGYLRGVRGKGALIATIATTKGTLRCELFEADAPMTVANFVGLATGQKPWLDPRTKKIVRGKPFYDGLTFHRVIPGFMVQGGDPLATGRGGPGYQFADEPGALAKKHVPGTLAMANAGPSTNGSQFFIDELEAPRLDGLYAVFGACKDVAVVTAIAGVPRDRDNKPEAPVAITKLTIARGTP